MMMMNKETCPENREECSLDSRDDMSNRSSKFDERSAESDHQDGKALASRESKAVWHLRLLVFAVLLLTMVLFSLGTYFYTSNAETDEFEQQFHEDATKVLQSLGESLDKAIAGVDTMVLSMLSYARDTNQTWPYVTVPDFESRSAKFLALTNAVVFMQFTLITPETRGKWEAYSADNGPAWAEKSIDYLKRNDMFQDVYEALNITDPFYLDFIHDYSAWGVEDPQGLPQNDSGPFLPMWQSAPLIPTAGAPVYNW
jgi:hypothetical protein